MRYQDTVVYSSFNEFFIGFREFEHLRGTHY